MSLAEKWEEYRAKLGSSLNNWESELARRAFYAGAEALLQTQPTAISLTQHTTNIELQAEIDRFKGLKTDAND